MQKYKSNITTTSGAAVRGVPVLVIDEDGNNAALFLDRAGTYPAPNPLTTGPDGVFYFYAVNGRYSLRTTVEGVTITDADVVLLMDPEEITVAGPIAEAVALAQDAAQRAEDAVANAGIPILITTAQNAAVDAVQYAAAAGASATAASLEAAAAGVSAAASSDSAAAALTSENAASDKAAEALASLNDLKSRYYGAFAAAPSLRPDGTARQAGDLYFNTMGNAIYAFNAGAWSLVPGATAADIANATDPAKGAALLGYSATGGTVAQALTASRTAQADYIENPANNPMAEYIQPRHARLSSLMADCLVTGAIPAGAGLGNSIMQGAGAATFVDGWNWRVGTKLQAYFATGTINNWASINYGVGGATIANVACYLADDGDTLPPTTGRIFGLYDYFYIMSLRNSAGLLSVADYVFLLRASIRQIKRAGKDAIMISENPKVDMATGAIVDTQANWGNWLDAAKRVCAEEGATFVDCWRYFVMLKTKQGLDLRTLTGDGTHPNSDGHSIVANLVYQGLMAPVAPASAWLDRRGIHAGKSFLFTKHVATSGTPTAIANLASNSTARGVHRNESPAQAYSMTAGSALYFRSPIPACGFIIDLINGSANTGSVSTTYQSVHTGTFNAASSDVVLEATSHSFWFNGSAFIGNVQGDLAITANGGPAQLGGIVFIGSDVYDCQPRGRNVIESGTWADSTLPANGGAAPAGGQARKASTVGDSLTISWYGHSLSAIYARSPDYGKFTYQTDGGTVSSPVDCYLNAPDSTGLVQTDKNLAEGWHTTVFSVATKNAAASGNAVSIGLLTSFSMAPMANTRFVALAVGDTKSIRGSWRQARIERVLAGSPRLEDWSAGNTVLTLTGTGAALVRLER